MKKLFTIDDFAIAFVAALGYGYGETLSRLFGWPEYLCVAASFALGIAAESIITRITFLPEIQKKKKNRYFTYLVIFLLFLAAHAVSVKWMGISMLDYLLEEFAYVVGLPILGFLVNLLIRRYRIQKIRSVYGEGKAGYQYDVDDNDREEFNLANRPISGEYEESLAVKTRTGIFVGKEQEDTLAYLGIPYAKPPVGELRWKAPESLPSSEAVFEAVHFGPSAVQVEYQGSILKHHRQSEDCLYLNIWVGTQKTDAKKPVLVLFHHGDFSFGGSADPLLDGDNFAAGHPGALVVSFNYRLGIYGFIDFSEVPGGEAYPDALNLGLLDQIAALQWIKKNISAFGGDPDRITVMGFESGAASICLLSASPRAKGLFQKAFVFFGSPEFAYDTPETSRALAGSLLKETKTASMAELVKLEPETLREAAQKLWRPLCSPTCDGALIPADVYSAYQKGAASGIEFILGIPHSEMRVFRSFTDSRKYEVFLSEVSDDAEIQNNSSDTLEARAKLLEKKHAFFMYRSAENLSEGGNQVHLLYWDEAPLIKNLGSGTVDAESAFLGNGDILRMYGSIMDDDLSEVLQCLLEKFITGNSLALYTNEIKGVDAIRWPAFPKALIVSKRKLSCGNIESIMKR